MSQKKVRGLIISFISAIVITFVAFFFGPLLPFNVSEGIIGGIFFILVILVSFIVYSLLPPDITDNAPSSQTVSLEDHVNNELG